MMSHHQLRTLFQKFWENKNHKLIPPIPLVPKDDPTTLFTGSGMQQLIPYLLGETHPQGDKLYNIQPCLRTQDIEEVGNNRHCTFFEMMGNWSLGDYFKKEQLNWFFSFLVDELKLDPRKLYVTVFTGDKQSNLPADNESIAVWKDIFKKYGIDAKEGERIFPYGPEKSWWSRAGEPKDMPVGEPGGPDSEVFFEFTQIIHDPKFGEKCHPNCDCGRFLEIGNSVFMEYKKIGQGKFVPLPKKNVDFGGGVERILMAVANQPDVFLTDIHSSTIKEIEKQTKQTYQDDKKSNMRIVADHLKSSVFLIKDGVLPDNKEQAYVLRRLIRRSIIKLRKLLNHVPESAQLQKIVNQILKTYQNIYFFSDAENASIYRTIEAEANRFNQTLERAFRQIEKIKNIDGKIAFDFYQNFGIPLELTEEIFKEKGQVIDKKQFRAEFEKHRQLSRASSTVKFKGGLADQSEQTIKYHTTTHLLHQALFDVLGSEIRQEGSNITSERLRFDFYAIKKPIPEEITKVQKIINEKIQASLPVEYKILPKEEALKLGAKSFFREKYPETVKIYCISPTCSPKDAYSMEFCGGPHVKNTAEIGKIEIFKFEKIGSNLYRIYAR